jgi:DNA-binding NarL/FixJ family response regulator
MSKTPVIIASNQYLVNLGLVSFISGIPEFELAGTAGSADELETILKTARNSIIILDFNLSAETDTAYINELKKKNPETGILILASQLSRTEVQALRNAGVQNAICINTSREEFLEAIEAAARRKKYYSSEILDSIIDPEERQARPTDHTQLTPTEKEIVKLVAEGLTTKEIADKRNLSFHTVITHRKNIFRKLKIKSVSELVMVAVRNGLINDIEYYI